MTKRKWFLVGCIVGTCTLGMAPNSAHAAQAIVDVEEWNHDFTERGRQATVNRFDEEGGMRVDTPLGNGPSDFDTDPDLQNIAFNFANDRGEFGAFVHAGAGFGNGLGDAGLADGAWLQEYVRDAATTTAIPFRISNTQLYLIDGTRDTDDRSGMFARIRFEITINGDLVIRERVEIGVENERFVVTDPPDLLSGNFEQITSGGGLQNIDGVRYTFNVFNGSIDVSGFDVGESFNVSYLWEVRASRGLSPEGMAYAEFWDPIGEAGAFSLDTTGLTPVPIPATAWLFISGLIGVLAMGRRRNR